MANLRPHDSDVPFKEVVIELNSMAKEVRRVDVDAAKMP